VLGQHGHPTTLAFGQRSVVEDHDCAAVATPAPTGDLCTDGVVVIAVLA
jgi:hypothetical protein